MKDLILRIASKDPDFRRELIVKLAARETHKPGDVWKTPQGKHRSMNQKGVAKTFKDQDKAKTYAKGKENKGKSRWKESPTGDPKGDQVLGDLIDLQKEYTKEHKKSNRNKKKLESMERSFQKTVQKSNSLSDRTKSQVRDHQTQWGIKNIGDKTHYS